MTNLLIVGLFAGVGALLRRNFTVFFKNKVTKKFGYLATFAINVLGSILIVLFFKLSKMDLILNPVSYLALTSGLLGGLTTFSTFNSELVNLWYQKRFLEFGCYFGGTYLASAFLIYLL